VELLARRANREHPDPPGGRVVEPALPQPRGWLPMARKRSKRVVAVSFKVNADLAALLNSLPNKSSFIRAAIVTQLGKACPLCDGQGRVSPSAYRLLEGRLQGQQQRPCDQCGAGLNLPTALETLSGPERRRWELFCLGGPLYCERCFPMVSPGPRDDSS
jgi:hypothetical protein